MSGDAERAAATVNGRLPTGLFVHRDLALCRELLLQITNQPDALMDAGTLYKKGSKGYSAMVAIDQSRYFLKKYYEPDPLKRYIDLFRGGRGKRAWQVHLRAHAAGLPVPEPYLYFERDHGRARRDGYLLMAFIDGSLDLEKVWRQADAPLRHALLGAAGAAIGAVHRGGFCHGDLKWYNILCRADAQSPGVVLSDLDSMQQVPRCFRSRYTKDLDRFVADLDRFDADGGCHDLFWDGYRRVLDAPRDV